MVMPPVPVAPGGPVVWVCMHDARPGHHDRRLVHNHRRWSYNYRCWLHDHGLWGNDDRRWWGDNRDREWEPQPDRHMHSSSVCREW